jgi:hypothetical protein
MRAVVPKGRKTCKAVADNLELGYNLFLVQSLQSSMCDHLITQDSIVK